MILPVIALFAWSLFGVEDGIFADKSADNKGNEGILITAKRGDLDKDAGVVMFEGEAFVRYEPNYDLHSNQLFAFFNSSNELERIVAIGNVAITNGLRRGSCAMAQFRRSKNEIELYGNEDGYAILAEDGKDELHGKRIKFWLDTEQVQVNGAKIFIEDSGKELKKL